MTEPQSSYFHPQNAPHNCALPSFYGNLLREDTNLKLDVSSFSIVIVYITVLAPNEGDDDQPNIRPHI